MLNKFRDRCKKKLFNVRSLLIAKLSNLCMKLLIRSCRIRIEGLEAFDQLAANEKCILMLWHNRLAIVPFVLSHYTPGILYAALVSGSRDGDILSSIILSCKNGRTIRVPHQGRFQALREIVRYVEERKQIVIITPDGPRGPCYELKPGIALAALETKANLVAFDWEAKHFWELKTWDRLRLPKPFTTISVKFQPPIRLDDASLEEAKVILKKRLHEF